MQRITDKQLNSLCDYLNMITNSPATYGQHTTDADGARDFKANIGHFHISHAYGGVCLHRVVNNGGGVNTPVVHGHVPKRELFNLMHAYIKGLEAVRYNDVNLKKAA